MPKLKVNMNNKDKGLKDQEIVNEELVDEERLVADMEDCEVKLMEAEERYKRVLADYRNLEYQVTQDRQQYVKLANRLLIENLLEPIDFMEKATKHIEDKGLQMVVDRFYQVLQMEGLEEIGVKVGQPFDESIMEAVDTVAGEDGKVVEVKQKGFTLNGSVIKHAKVAVGRNA